VARKIYRFLDYQLDATHRVISRGATLLSISPKVVDTLVVLVEHAGAVVDKDTLMRAIWPDTTVVESSLTRNISVLRKALAGGGSGEAIIQTVSKRGYRFLPPVEILDDVDGVDVSSPEPLMAPGGNAADASPHVWRTWMLVGMAIAAGMVGLWLVWPDPAPVRSSVLTEADREYLLGRQAWNKVEPGQVERALRRFERAAALDPNDALAHAGIADSHLLMIQLAVTNRARSLDEARAAAERAIALDPDLALPHASLGYIAAMSGLDLRSARREFERAVALGPSVTLPGHGDYLTWLGDLNGARAYYAHALQSDPVSANIATRLARLEYFAGRFDHAIALLHDVLDREPSFSLARYYLALSYAFQDRIEPALRELARAQLNTNLLATDEAWIQARGGDAEPARALIDARFPDVMAGTRKWTELLIPALAVGDRDLAMRALEGMWKTQEIELLHLKVDPRFEPLRADPRFEALTRRVFGTSR
jgi:DNA-binding winged helix-turn-helix (wHTH) protein/tetratricopeptide (TPR) repeat protein